MGPGDFTNQGHFIVLSGLTEDGHVLVNDPTQGYGILAETMLSQAETAMGENL